MLSNCCVRGVIKLAGPFVLQMGKGMKYILTQDRILSVDYVMLPCTADGSACFGESLVVRKDLTRLEDLKEKTQLASRVFSLAWRARAYTSSLGGVSYL